MLSNIYRIIEILNVSNRTSTFLFTYITNYYGCTTITVASIGEHFRLAQLLYIILYPSLSYHI